MFMGIPSTHKYIIDIWYYPSFSCKHLLTMSSKDFRMSHSIPSASSCTSTTATALHKNLWLYIIPRGILKYRCSKSITLYTAQYLGIRSTACIVWINVDVHAHSNVYRLPESTTHLEVPLFIKWMCTLNKIPLGWVAVATISVGPVNVQQLHLLCIPL